MKKIILALVLMAMVGGFSILPGMNGEALADDCEWLRCQSENDAGCDCGTVTTTKDKLFCCAENNAVYADKNSCQVSSCAAEKLPEDFKAPTLNVINAIQTATNWIFYILILISVVYLILGGIGYVTAQGDAEKVKASGQKVMWALIGVVVAILARGLVNLVSKAIGGGSYY